MATLDQVPPQGELYPNMVASAESDQPSALDRVLARAYTLNWEALFYIGLFILAVFTRFVNLGDRVMSHDESLHTKYSHDLYKQGNFQHTPLMHGPILFHMTALAYFLFGDSDFSARLYPAILGVIMVMMPKLLFERWLGKMGAMAASIFILISPMLLFHHRYIREDTPAIFYTILMAYAVFAYIDGRRPRQVWHLILFSAATLLNLGSKETAFMYILIFALFFGLFLLIQMVQGWRKGVHTSVVGWATLGVVGVPLIGIGTTILLLVLRSEGIFDALSIFSSLTVPATEGGFALSPELAGLLGVLVVGLPIMLLLSAAVIVIYSVLYPLMTRQIATPLMAILADRGVTIYKLSLTGILMGTTAALVMTNVLTLIPPESIRASQAAWSAYEAAGAQGIQPAEAHPDYLLGRLIVWTTALLLILLLATLTTATLRFRRLPRLPWMEIAYIAFIAAASFFVLIFVEERSRLVPNVSSEVRPIPSEFNNWWIYGSWLVGILATLGIAFLRLRTQFWQQMRRYAAFDVIIVLGSLVLPWSAALPIFQAGYPLDGSSYATREINAMVLGVIPFVLVAVAAGLAWRPGVWMTCAATFYGIFAFFFTTIFTNPQGIATGVVGSLGYWLAQQGVRRGSQPQYYYMLIQLPIYEYLVMIGGFFAGVLGLSLLWRFRAERYATAQESGNTVRNAEIEAVTTDGPDIVNLESETLDVASMNVAEPQVQPQNSLMFSHTDEAGEAANEYNPNPTLAYTENEVVSGNVKQKRFAIPAAELLERPLFTVFVGFWGVMILFALTLAGEKMPWLTTHIALPFALVSGWYVGKVLESVNWREFFNSGWALIVLIPVALVGAANVFGGLVFGNLGGLAREDQLRTFTWLGALVLMGICLYAIWRILLRFGLAQGIRVAVLGFFVLLGILTARTAWLAAYINYDSAKEFMVYAHAAPANKEVLAYIEDIAARTGQGTSIRVGFDNQFSWPGSWYFRDYPGSYVGDLSGGLPNIDEYVALAVGDNNYSKIAAQAADKFYVFDLIRLWWPMQEYFGLNLQRVDNALGDAEMRQALWEIWFNREYDTYTRAYARMTGDQNTQFREDKWPVADRMKFLVRKDVAAQVWDFGVGSARVSGLPEDPFANLRCDTCAAELTYAIDQNTLNAPRGIAFDLQGNLYVTDSRNGRIAVYDADGNFLRQIGMANLNTDQNVVGDPGTLREPWSVDVGPDGKIYVADTWHHRVQVFNPDGTVLSVWGNFEQFDANVTGSSTGFYGPRDIKVDSQGRIYVADTGNKRVRVYDAQGTLIRDIGKSGGDVGSLYEPVGMAINERTNEIFIASTWAKRIDVYTLDGLYVRSWDIRAWYATTPTQDTGNRPYLALDPTGTYLFVTDPDAARVLIFDTNGTPVLSFGRLGTAPFTQLNQFGVLGGITFDPQGRLVMADAGGNRILRFAVNAFPGVTLPSGVNPGDFGLPTLESEATAEATSEPTIDQQFAPTAMATAEAGSESPSVATPEATSDATEEATPEAPPLPN
ncbi:MAG: hypothetical protein OHK0023_12420 [Anaerolineae bacterium]